MNFLSFASKHVVTAVIAIFVIMFLLNAFGVAADNVAGIGDSLTNYTDSFKSVSSGFYH
jgi:hypothetical protein